MSKVKKIVVISGKGGTGKTTVTASLASIMTKPLIVDTDVDAANLYLLLKPRNIRSQDFQGKPVAAIDKALCSSCNLCKEYCRFSAIERVGQPPVYRVDPFACEGCTLCSIVCPTKAIQMQERMVGQWFLADTDDGKFVYARLKPGAENSGSLVTEVKNQADTEAIKTHAEYILIDGPPGIGCPVIASLSGTDMAIIVTEPTVSAREDLERVLELTRHFGIQASIVVNRYDINPDNTRGIENFAAAKEIPVIARIPHSLCIMESIAQASIPSKHCKELAGQVEKIYEYVKNI